MNTINEHFNAIHDARQTMGLYNKITPFSQWYKGDHDKARKDLIKAVRAFVQYLNKQSPVDITLLQGVKGYLDSLYARSTENFRYDNAVKAWQDAHQQ